MKPTSGAMRAARELVTSDILTETQIAEIIDRETERLNFWRHLKTSRQILPGKIIPPNGGIVPSGMHGKPLPKPPNSPLTGMQKPG
jgi:hypothetical protein